MSQPAETPATSNGVVFNLYVETLLGTYFELRVSPFEPVKSVKARIQRLQGIPLSQQHLLFHSLELDNERHLQDYNINAGDTLQLVLAMRGGPINTRRVPVPDDVAWKEVQDFMESHRDELWERSNDGTQVTLLVFRDGNQINFYRVVEREDGTFSPLSESWSGSSMRNLFAEEEEGDAEVRNLENKRTMAKMQELQRRMQSKKKKNQPSRPSSRKGSGKVTFPTKRTSRTSKVFHAKPKTPDVKSEKVSSEKKVPFLPSVENTAHPAATSDTVSLTGSLSTTQRSETGFLPSSLESSFSSQSRSISRSRTNRNKEHGFELNQFPVLADVPRRSIQSHNIQGKNEEQKNIKRDKKPFSEVKVKADRRQLHDPPTLPEASVVKDKRYSAYRKTLSR